MPTDSLVNPEEYLTRERAAERKHEYRSGRMVLTGGANATHALIVTNLIAELGNQLRDTACRLFASALRVRSGDGALFAYPDVAVTSAEPRCLDEQQDVLLNPALIIEVMAEATREYDRGDKFARYRTIDTLREYVLIDQEQTHAARFVRQDDDRWMMEETDDPDATITLSSVEAELALAEVYHKVEWKA